MFDHLREIMVCEHGDMAEHVVEAVRRFEIIQLLAPADEIPDREQPFAEHGEEDGVGNQPGNRNDPPAGARLEDRVEAFDVRHPRMRQS